MRTLLTIVALSTLVACSQPPAEPAAAPPKGGPAEDQIQAAALVKLQASLSAFRRDLTALLHAHAWQWVAYSGSRQLGVGPSKAALYQKCFKLGLKRGEFIVESVEPEISREVDLDCHVSLRTTKAS